MHREGCVEVASSHLPSAPYEPRQGTETTKSPSSTAEAHGHLEVVAPELHDRLRGRAPDSARESRSPNRAD